MYKYKDVHKYHVEALFVHVKTVKRLGDLCVEFCRGLLAHYSPYIDTYNVSIINMIYYYVEPYKYGL